MHYTYSLLSLPLSSLQSTAPLQMAYYAIQTLRSLFDITSGYSLGKMFNTLDETKWLRYGWSAILLCLQYIQSSVFVASTIRAYMQVCMCSILTVGSVFYTDVCMYVLYIYVCVIYS